MNRFLKSLMVVALVAMIGFMSGCDDDDDPGTSVDETEVTRVFNLLSASPWSVSGVTVDELDFSSTYDGLSLTFAEGTYTSANGGSIFSPAGTWVFASTAADIIILDGDLEVDVLEISEAALSIGLFSDESSIGTGGRSESVSGNHVFTFAK